MNLLFNLTLLLFITLIIQLQSFYHVVKHQYKINKNSFFLTKYRLPTNKIVNHSKFMSTSKSNYMKISQIEDDGYSLSHKFEKLTLFFTRFLSKEPGQLILVRHGI